MIKKSMFMMILLLMLAPIFLSSCSRDDVAIVRIQIKNMPQGENVSVFERFLHFFITEGYAFSNSNWFSSFQELSLKVEGDDIGPITANLPPTSSTQVYTIEVPAGYNRIFTVTGKNITNGYGINWGGKAETSLYPGDEVDMQINMLPMVKMEGVTYSGSIMTINWDNVSDTSALYGVQGYKIYRSNSGPDGPFVLIKTVPGFTSFTTTDTGLVNGTYYYSASVYTSNSEGVLCSPQMDTVP